MRDTQASKPKAPKNPKRGWRIFRICLIVLALLLVLILVAALLFPKQVNLDRVVRFFRYMGLRDKESYGTVTFDAGASNCYGSFDGGLLVAGEGGLILYDMEAERKCTLQTGLTTPVLSTGEEIAVCYSPGGTYLGLIGSGGKVLADKNLSGALTDAEVSPDGYLCYLTEESGYKSVATVLNKNQEPMYVLYSRSSYLNACAVCEKGRLLAVATLGEKRSVFRSGVTILRTDTPINDLDTEESGVVRADLGNRVVYDLQFLDKEHLCAVCQDEICILDAEGSILETLSLDGQTLLDYAVSDKGFLVLALEKNGRGTRKVTVLDETGKTLAELEPEDRLLSVSAAGKYVAVLTGSDLQIYDKELDRYFRTTELHGAQRVLARDDGTALLIGVNSAKLYIP